MQNFKITVIIPAYNEEKTIGRVVRETKKVLDKLCKNNLSPNRSRKLQFAGQTKVCPPKNGMVIEKYKIVVVDDGSTDKTGELAQKASAIVLRHQFNQGYGRATITGFSAAKKIGYPIVISMDGDGQHDPRDIPKLISPLVKNQADLVIGSRLLTPRGMPIVRLWGNRFLSQITSLLFRQKIRDSQSGFRAKTLSALKKLHLTGIGFEVCAEIIGEAWRAGLRLKEVPIKTIYTRYSRKKEQNIFNGINIVLSSLYRLLTR